MCLIVITASRVEVIFHRPATGRLRGRVEDLRGQLHTTAQGSVFVLVQRYIYIMIAGIISIDRKAWDESQKSGTSFGAENQAWN